MLVVVGTDTGGVCVVGGVDGAVVGGACTGGGIFVAGGVLGAEGGVTTVVWGTFAGGVEADEGGVTVGAGSAGSSGVVGGATTELSPSPPPACWLVGKRGRSTAPTDGELCDSPATCCIGGVSDFPSSLPQADTPVSDPPWHVVRSSPGQRG